MFGVCGGCDGFFWNEFVEWVGGGRGDFLGGWRGIGCYYGGDGGNYELEDEIGRDDMRAFFWFEKIELVLFNLYRS